MGSNGTSSACKRNSRVFDSHLRDWIIFNSSQVKVQSITLKSDTSLEFNCAELNCGKAECVIQREATKDTYVVNKQIINLNCCHLTTCKIYCNLKIDIASRVSVNNKRIEQWSVLNWAATQTDSSRRFVIKHPTSYYVRFIWIAYLFCRFLLLEPFWFHSDLEKWNSAMLSTVA